MINNQSSAFRRRITVIGRILGGVLILTVLFFIGFTIGYYMDFSTQAIPDLSAVLTMTDEDATMILSSFTEQELIESWGAPIDAYDWSSKAYGPHRRLIFKASDSLDHIDVSISNSTGRVIHAECWQAFRAYWIYSFDDLSGGTVHPCPWEAEATCGDILEINYRTSRPVVLEYLDGINPVIIYYKGTVNSPDDNHRFPYINTVEDMQFYDNTLEPLDVDETK